MVQFGPADYSVSVGKPGQARSPEIQRAEKEMVKLALKKGIAPRLETSDLEEAQKYFEMGVRHFCIGVDLGAVSDWCKQQAKGGVKSLLAAV